MLLEKIDCTHEYPVDKYFSYGPTEIIDSPIGKYRQAENKPFSRFGYRFNIADVGKPHEIVIRYPDDKRRFMTISDGTTYDMSTGIMTGLCYPISGEMQEVRVLFWPRWRDCSVCIMTWGHDEPAAVAEIEIHRASALQALHVASVSGNREFGIQYEDPCGTGASEGAKTFDEWLNHVVEYSKYTGQSLFSYPICWYHGPLFPAKNERADVFSVVVADDRNQYIAWTDNPPDWPSKILARFEQESLKFQGVFTLLRLPSLMKQMNADLDAIESGVDTINNMLCNDYVQAGTMDWTPVYNSLNYDKLLKRDEPLSLKNKFDWAYGESTEEAYKPDAHYTPGPIFNPLHPTVQNAIINFFRDTCERYAGYSSFTGLAVTMWAPTILWFGSIRSGYDDYSIKLFESETGIRVPVNMTLSDRFSRRYDFLMQHASLEWQKWRCEKIHELICKIRDTMVAIRPDLRLTLNLWSEPYIPAILGNGKPEHQIFSRTSTYQLYRQAGLDMNMFANDENIELDLQTEGGGRDRTPGHIENANMEQFYMFRDHDFLDEETLRAEHEQMRPGVFIFNAWHEAWGKHHWFECDVADQNRNTVGETYGCPTEHIFRINSEYPADGFWWNSQLRITPAFPAGEHFMEQYVHAIAEMDACRITRGGLFLDKAHSELLRKFAAAFCSLPAVKFNAVGKTSDPLVVRELGYEGERYFYVVNREYYPVICKILFSAKPANLVDISTGESRISTQTWTLQMMPYELKVFKMELSCNICEFSIEVPEDIKRQIIADSHEAIDLLQALQFKGVNLPGAKKLSQKIAEAIQLEKLAWLRKSLNCYIVHKAKELC